jgi:hypothetical protein
MKANLKLPNGRARPRCAETMLACYSHIRFQRVGRVEFRFIIGEWGQLSPNERVRRCQLMAAEARLLAERAPPQLKERYLAIADVWLWLEAEVERKSS